MARTERSPSCITRVIMRISCRLDRARAFRLGDEQPDLLLGDPLLRLLVAPEQAQDEPRGDLEQSQPTGAGHAGERRHWRRHEGGNALGIAERDLLGHELADDERKISDDRDHDGNPDRLGGPGPKTEHLEPVGQILGQGSPTKGAGEHPDERDADLDAGEEAGLIVEQAQRRPGPRAAFSAMAASAAGGGDEREFGHGKEAIEDDQEGNDAEFEGEHGVPREGLEEGSGPVPAGTRGTYP